MIKCMALNQKDNVATLLLAAKRGEVLEIIDPEKQHLGEIMILEDIEFAHKLALCEIPFDGDIIKSGEVIGKATKEIGKGAHAHVHNIQSIEGTRGKK